ncbi:MAG TPA: hypothetical protein VFS54_01240 [Solirubrobacterales bacterium]|nr:hypothetical protein [Solirubrobacterales bacterium]
MEFHGELDFADASATRVGGNRIRDFRTVCKRRGRARGFAGPLGVALPGAGIVPLTGPTFAAALCRGPGEPEQRPCSELLGD